MVDGCRCEIFDLEKRHRIKIASILFFLSVVFIMRQRNDGGLNGCLKVLRRFAGNARQLNFTRRLRCAVAYAKISFTSLSSLQTFDTAIKTGLYFTIFVRRTYYNTLFFSNFLLSC
jgi:hypothetical protein